MGIFNIDPNDLSDGHVEEPDVGQPAEGTSAEELEEIEPGVTVADAEPDPAPQRDAEARVKQATAEAAKRKRQLDSVRTQNLALERQMKDQAERFAKLEARFNEATRPKLQEDATPQEIADYVAQYGQPGQPAQSPDIHRPEQDQVPTEQADFEKIARTVFEDYDDLKAKWAPILANDPVMVQKVHSAPNQARALYDLCKEMEERSQEDSMGNDPQRKSAKGSQATMTGGGRGQVNPEFTATTEADWRNVQKLFGPHIPYKNRKEFEAVTRNGKKIRSKRHFDKGISFDPAGDFE